MATQPYVSKPDSEPPSAPADAPLSEKEFNPFRFAVTELPTGMRQELIATELPVVPAEQLFDTKPPNRNLAAITLKELPAVPDSLPALDSSKSLARPNHAKRNLLLGVIALTVLALAVALALQPPDRPKSAARSPDTQINHAPPPVVQLPAPPTSAAPIADSPTSSPRKPSPPVTDRAPAPKSARAPAKTSLAAQPQTTVTSGLPDVTPPAPKKESALGSVLAPPPD